MNKTPTKETLTNSRARFALIDADSVLYAVALSAEVCMKGKGPDGEDEWLPYKDLDECYAEVQKRLGNLLNETNSEDALLCLTPTSSCFRYQLLPSYKANRKTMRRPAILRDLQIRVMEEKPFRVLAVRGLEADDICGISQTQLQQAKLREPVIVSIDKDMQQVPGLLYNPMEALRTGTIGDIREVSELQADKHHMLQTMVGDPVDNYTGCPGLGPVKANKVLTECVAHGGDLDWKWIVEAFKKRGYDEDFALTQARVARILRDTDWNPKTHEVRLWTPTTDTSSRALPQTTTSQHAPRGTVNEGARQESATAGTPSGSQPTRTINLRDLPKMLKPRPGESIH